MTVAPHVEVIAATEGVRPLGAVLIDALRDSRWNRFRACVAFLKRSGFQYLARPLDDFLSRDGAEVSIAVGIDHHGTSLEGLQDLWRLIDGRGDLFVFKEGQGGLARTYHPKGYVLEGADRALALVGSGNLTAGGLFNNHELSAAIEVDLADRFATDLRSVMDVWHRPGPACHLVDEDLLKALVESGELVPESVIAAGARAANASASRSVPAGRPTLFGASGQIPSAPPPEPLPPLGPPAVEIPAATAGGRRSRRGSSIRGGGAGRSTTGPHQTFVITVRPHDNGEVFLSTGAFKEDPGFFGAPLSGWTVPKRRGNPSYPMAQPDPFVRIVVHDDSGAPIVELDHPLNLVHYLRNSEIRITIPPDPLAAIGEGWLLAMTREPSPAYDYALEFFPPDCSHRRAQELSRHLTVKMPSGGAPFPRYYGWA